MQVQGNHPLRIGTHSIDALALNRTTLDFRAGERRNWREKSIEALNREGHAKLHYTAPMTLSKADAELVREMIVKLLESIDKVIEPSPSEELRCLNIDWFEVTR